ncbi:MAG: radical SAM protein [Clostridia bacterium]|nr:radical SAM protein [Clostridia bacterium]
MNGYQNCKLCPRECGVNRVDTKGYCGMSDSLFLARAALHFWEEPCISGNNGSGTVFFSGCNMKCVYCQNHSIAIGETGKAVSFERLCEIYFELKEKGANNINLVTPSHYLPHVIKSIERAKLMGFDLPFVYNTSAYEKTESIKALDGLIDIYLPDYKYFLSKDSKKYSNAPDYPSVALKAIDEMHRQVSPNAFNDGIMQRGIIIRHLLLPGKVIESKLALKCLYERYGDSVYLSIMNQYTPLSHVECLPELNRRVSNREYNSLCDYAAGLGIKNAYIQNGETAMESFIPSFDFEGI